MKKPVLKWKTRNRVIIALAYFHNFLCPMLLAIVPMLIGGVNLFLLYGIGFCLYGLYSLVGFKLRWKHIYCSYQNLHRKKMTPDNICWGTVKRSGVYGTPIAFGIVGAACIVCHFLFV